MISPKLYSRSISCCKVDVLGLEPVFQLLDFRIRAPERLFRPLALLYFLRELHVRSGQLSGPFLHRLFQHLAVILDFLVQQPHFQHVVDARQHFGQIERFADEILRAGFQRAQLVARLGGDHEDRKIAVRFDFLQAFHHLESVHAGHLQIEQDQVVAVLAVKLADLLRIHRGRDASIAGAAQHLLEQPDIGFLIVNDQDAGVKNIGGTRPSPGSRLLALV